MDDSAAIRQLIMVNLELDGFEVMAAADGADCLEAVHVFRPDVITLDRAMPRLDGLRAAALLRDDPRTAHIPLVLVSAGLRPDLPLGVVDAVLRKPFEPSELVRVVRGLRAEGRAQPVQLAKRLARSRGASRTLAP